MLVVMFRHGARKEVTNIIPSEKKSNFGKSHLTPVGMKEHYLLGKQLRKTYGDFIPLTYSNSKMEVLCSGKSRTIVSAMSNFIGLFPLN